MSRLHILKRATHLHGRGHRPGSDADRLLIDWVTYGAQSVCMADTYAAALIATATPATAEVFLPWPVFEVQIPHGLLPLVLSVFVAGLQNDAGQWRYTTVPETSRRIAVAPYTTYLVHMFNAADALDGALDGCFRSDGTNDAFQFSAGYRYSDPQHRVWTLVARLAVNAAIAISNIEPEKRVSRIAHKLSVPHGVVRPREFVLGEPIKLDCRQAVRDFAEGRASSSPSVSTLVRGHWRHQPCGPKNQQRRLQWIQPFFRGDGPLLVRPALIGCAAGGVK